MASHRSSHFYDGRKNTALQYDFQGAVSQKIDQIEPLKKLRYTPCNK